MKLIILKKNLKDGLRSIERICAENPSLPILKNFLIETIDNKIKLAATNLELGITTFISGKIIENGSVTIPLNIFNSIINNLQVEKINLELKKDKLIIKTDNYQAEIQGIKKEEFPIIPQIGNIKQFIKIKNSLLKNALISAVNSATADNRPELSGILFDFQITILKLAATDTFRLSEKTIANNHFESNFDGNFKVIIPLKTIQEVIKEIQSNESQETKIYIDQNQVLFKTENTEIISRLINGEFPDYQQIIPKNIANEIILNAEELINAVKLSSVFSDKFNEIKIIINKDAKNVEIFSASQSVGENKYLVPAKIQKMAENQMEISFNWRFLLDGLKNIKSENIFLGLNDLSKPALIKSPQDESWIYILMPIKS
ncbi:MAG: DNA polymerase III subunit beta [Patescibacteria group bacterium]|nr:DNA polymerase III subunit beta [Patescibacteria group bacterium]